MLPWSRATGPSGGRRREPFWSIPSSFWASKPQIGGRHKSKPQMGDVQPPSAYCAPVSNHLWVQIVLVCISWAGSHLHSLWQTFLECLQNPLSWSPNSTDLYFWYLCQQTHSKDICYNTLQSCNNAMSPSPGFRIFTRRLFWTMSSGHLNILGDLGTFAKSHGWPGSL